MPLTDAAIRKAKPADKAQRIPYDTARKCLQNRGRFKRDKTTFLCRN